jgi:anti-anti-sigma factor
MDLTVDSQGQYQIFTLAGKIDWEGARQLDERIQKEVEAGRTQLAFDLNRVTFLCSGAIGALAFNLNKVKKEGGSFYIISSNDYVNYVFSTLRFDAMFGGRFYSTIEDFRTTVLEQTDPPAP